MLDVLDKVIEMSLRLNKFTSNLQTIQEMLGIQKKSRSWREKTIRNRIFLLPDSTTETETNFCFQSTLCSKFKLFLTDMKII